MLEPLEEWICDTCGDVIAGEDQGYAIWKMNDERRRHSFQIIHQGRCDRDDHNRSLPLERLTGTEGVVKLQSWLSDGPFHGGGGRGVVDLDEYVDFFRRLQVPRYEEARHLFTRDEALDHFGGANEYAPYLPDNMKRLIKEVTS